MAKYIELSDENFDENVLKADKPVLVDFWAAWCGPCKMMSPVIDELATSYEGKAVITKVNVDDCGNTSQRYGIMNIPTILIFKSGVQVEKVVGVQSKKALSELIEKHV